MTGKLSGNIKYLVIGLLLFSGINNALLSQSKPLGGIINSYGRVTSFGLDYVTVKDDGPNAGQFAAFEVGDTVMLIQMKGARTQVVDALYGQLEGTYGVPGQHEFLIIESINSGAKQITFRNNISHATFSTAGGLQIVKVPTYNAATVVSTLTCAPWDSISKTGGVVALIAGRTITLNDSISVIGKGFKGGATATGMNICAETSKMYKYAYAATGGIDSAGFKGESPVSRGFLSVSNYPAIYPGYAKGKGANLSGGGGGDGKFSGGGGGGNYGAGGTGGREIGCTINYPGGLGGLQIKGTYLANTLKSIFLGGGGGASTFISGTPKPGGNGGGIIILISDTIKAASNKFITADGAGAKAVTGNAGAGGGGGGGTVAIYTSHYANLTITAKGGNGGNNAGTFGEGGGGGGGLITSNTPASSTAITRSVAGGAVGDRSGTETGTGGSAGDNLLTWVPILNGFLFNSIRSSVTNTQIDSICSNVTPPPVTGTMPVGGSGNYNYVWQKSYNSGGSWIEIANGPAFKDYSFSASEADTFLIRRIVVDNTTTLTDTSKWVQIRVTPAITGNLVGKDTTICNGQNPLSLIPLNSGPSNGNPKKYYYQWLQNPDNLNWTTSPNATGTSNLASFDPPVLNTTTFYKRKITSGRCENYSSSVKITVLPSITGNTWGVRPDSVICEGSSFNVLTTSAPGGGTGAFTYLWQDSITTGTWQPAAGTNNTTTHAPSVIPFATTEHRYFRRVVISGPSNVCKNFSSPIRLTMWQSIENNTISADQTICSGVTPAQLTGLTPTQGDHTYTYQWQDSSKTATWTSRSTTGTPYGPSALTDTTWYRRIVNSSKCSSISNRIVVNVHDPITNNTVAADTTICNGSNPNKIRGKLPVGGNNIFSYQWYSSNSNFVSDSAQISISGTLINYDPSSLAATISYRREVISGMCRTKSNKVTVTVLPSITNNTITPDKPEVCFNTSPGLITGSPLTGGAGGTPTWIWQDSTSGVAFTNISGASTQSYDPPGNITKQTWYRRIIKSGPADCCISTSPKVPIDTIKLPTAAITSIADTTICGGNEVKLRVHLTGAKNWNLVYNEGATAVPVNNISSGNYTISRTPSVGSSMATFNYSLASLTDNNGCIAVPAGLTGTRKAIVYRVPVANAGPPSTSVCGTAFTLAAVPTDGTGTWTFPAQVISGDPSLYNAAIAIASFSEQNVTYKFYWKELNWTCTSKDSISIRFDHEIVDINAGEDVSLMSFDNAIQLHADPIKSYEKGKWSITEGSGTFDDDESAEPWLTGVALGTNIFKWTVENGDCVEEDLVTYMISDPVIPEMISPNNDTFNDDLTISGINLETQKVELTILNGAGSLVFSTSNANSNADWKNWDGTNSKGEELPEGTYYYLLKVSSGKVEGLVSRKSGFIILKRK